jgi:hypothetical protein
MKILVDQSVYSKSYVFSGAYDPEQGPDSPNRLIGAIPRKIDPGRASFILREWPHLAKLARHSLSGGVKFYTTFVLLNEAFPTLLYGNQRAFPTNFFHFCDEEWINDPFRVVSLGPLESQPAWNFDQAIEFSIRDGIDRITRAHSDKDTSGVESLFTLLKMSPPKHYRDIYNIYLGHVNFIDYFLTFDGKIIRYLTETMRNPFRCAPVFPSTISPRLGDASEFEFRLPDDEFYLHVEMMKYWRSIGLIVQNGSSTSRTG